MQTSNVVRKTTWSILKFSKAVAAVSLVTAFSLSATKAFGEDLSFGLLTAPVSRSMANTISTSGIFTDNYSFSVTSEASLAGILAAVSFMDIVGITDFSSSLWLGGQELAVGDTTTYSAGGFSAITSVLSYSPLLAGDPPPIYQISVTGTVLGTSGSYGGAMVLRPVPEPEIYAMLGIGMGVMGWAARRKKRKHAAVV